MRQIKAVLAKCTLIIVIALMILGLSSSESLSTNGYFSHGFGTKHKGLAGAGSALPLSGFAVAQNPGAVVFLEDGYDVSLALFNPNRQYTVSGDPSQQPGTFGLAPSTVESESRAFFIPAISANRKIGENMAVSASVYGNGGMNTHYETSTFYGTTPTGVDLSQLFFAPAIAFKGNGRHAIGVNPILAYQRFEARGLQAFAAFSSDPEHLTDKGHDSSVGYGGRVGYLGKLTDRVSIASSYQTKIYMSEFDDYAGLFADQGSFDIPANWTMGLAVTTDPIDFVFDVQRIYYSATNSVGNPMLPNLTKSPLGQEGAAGFGWKDMTVFKGGFQVRTGNSWTWRAGYSRGEQPIPESEMLFNILAPGVMEQHLTVGLTKRLKGSKDLSLVVTRALSKSITGPNPLEIPEQQEIGLEMDQWEAAVGVSF